MSVYPNQFTCEMDLEEYKSQKTSQYLIASTPRCGSHMLGHSLYEANGYGVPLEYFNRSNLKKWQQRFNTDNLNTIFDEIIKLRTSSNGHFGVKAHWDQYSKILLNSEFKDYFDFTKIIWIYRADLLSQSISLVVAMQTGAWISGAPKKGNAAYDYNAIAEAAARINKSNYQWWKYLSSKNSNREIMVVRYEDLLKPNEHLLNNVGKFINPHGNKLHLPTRVATQGGSINNEWRNKFIAKIKPEHGWILECKSWII